MPFVEESKQHREDADYALVDAGRSITEALKYQTESAEGSYSQTVALTACAQALTSIAHSLAVLTRKL